MTNDNEEARPSERKHLIGGTDAATLIGLGTESQLHLYMRLRGEVEDTFEGNTATKLGKLIEEHAARPTVADEFGRTLVRPKSITYVHPAEARIGASLDYIDGEDGTPAEIKFTGSRVLWGPSGSHEVPTKVWAQVQFQLAIMRAAGNPKPFARIYVFFSMHGFEPAVFEVPEEEDTGSRLIAAALDMLERVDHDAPPDPKDEADSRAFYLSQRGFSMTCTEEQLEQLRWLARAQDAKKSLESDIKAIRDTLIPTLGEASELVDEGGNVVATYRANKTLDHGALMELHPEVIERYQSTSIDWSRLKRENKTLVSQFMREPEDPNEQVRQLRIKIKEDDHD